MPIELGHTQAQSPLFFKISQLPAPQIRVIEDFVDFLRSKKDDFIASSSDAQLAAKMSEASFAAVWDNDSDADYDKL